MKVAGQATLHAPIERVWAALNDPAVLVRTIPGCQRLEATGPDAYAMTVTAGVASIKGTYAGTVALAELREPNSFVMKAAGSGGPGTVSADVRVSLNEVGGNTELSYDADAVVGGVIGGVGQRMLVGVAKKMAGEFFSSVDDVLTGKAATVPAPADTALTAGVFTAPEPDRRLPAGAGEATPFMLGALFGAAAALLGVLVGARTARGTRRF
ncbi:MAG: carbon monoxide dehydrogenase subunit G [Actinomycetota bacterium]|nr:carbon monoxide dehydrogenase subunit G [Actinomycetota bacterium]MDQ2958316.1 carbon monoxide dehydrogenase subunit G [Actinomycetota bacterium]